jgi:hypothetical protein
MVSLSLRKVGNTIASVYFFINYKQKNNNMKTNKKQQLPTVEEYLNYIKSEDVENNVGWKHSVYHK